MKSNRKNRWIAGLLCMVMLFAAIPVFTTEVEAAAVEFEWGYPEATKDTADAGVLDVTWTRGGFYGNTQKVVQAGPVGTIVANRDYSFSEGIIVKPGMKIWWFDYSDPAPHNACAVVTFWTDATFSTVVDTSTCFNIKTGLDVADDGKFVVLRHTDEVRGVYMQNFKSTSGEMCYTYWNTKDYDQYVTLSYKGTSACPVYYSMGEPQLMGEEELPLPRQLVTGIEWASNTRNQRNGDGCETVNKTQDASAAGYLRSSTITVAPGQSLAFFGDRSLNAQTGEDSQYCDPTNPTLTFAVYTTTGTFLPNESLDIGSAKINKGTINNTGVVAYWYTNNSTETRYVRISYCSASQQGTSVAPKLNPSNVYLYEKLDTYKAIRANTDVATGYFTNAGPAMNTVVETPAAPSKTQDGIFMGWSVKYTKDGNEVTEFYPPETQLSLTLSNDVTKIKSEIKVTPVYIDALPFTYDGASIRTWLPTGLQFKLYFRKDDYKKMLAQAEATGGSLSVGAFAVPHTHLNYFLKQNPVSEGTTYDAIKSPIDGSKALSTETQDLLNEKLTMKWFDDNQAGVKQFVEQGIFDKYGITVDYQADMYVVARTQGGYISEETIDGVTYCVTYFTIAESYKSFAMDFAARPFLSVQYKKADGTYGYGEPLYGDFKNTNIRSTEEVLLKTLRMSSSGEVDYRGVKYFSENEQEVIDNVNEVYGNKGSSISSLTYYDPLRGGDVTIYSRRFSGPAMRQLRIVLAETNYKPQGKKAE